MKGIGNALTALVIALVAIAVAAPAVIRLSHALVPVLIVGALAVIAVRWAFFATRRW